MAQLQQLAPADGQGLAPEQLLGEGLSSSGADGVRDPTLALLATLEQPTLSELYFETELELDAHVERGEHVWAAIVFEEVPEEGSLQPTHHPNPNPYILYMYIYYPHQVPEEGALQQTWAYKLRFNLAPTPAPTPAPSPSP